MSWNRLLWGVQLDGAGLLGASWHAEWRARPGYLGEPSRPLLFTTRRDARQWCKDKMEDYRARYAEGHICRDWSFRPVRVRERVAVVRP